MSVATEDSRAVVPLSEMFGKLVEMRLECMAINEAVDGVVKLREAAEAAYAKGFKECEDVGDSPLCPEEEADLKKDLTDRYIYEKGFYDGIFTVQHSLNVCVSGLEGVKPSTGLRLPRYAVANDENGSGPIKWVKLEDGSYLVDPKYLAEYYKKYPDAVMEIDSLQPIPSRPGQKGLKCSSRADQDSQA